MARYRLVEIEVTKLKKDRYNFRQPRTVDPYLKDSIQKWGIQVPLLVRPLSKEERSEGVEYGVVDGARRLMAAEELGIRRVPCLVEDVEKREVLLRSLRINLLRENVEPYELVNALLLIEEVFGSLDEFLKDPRIDEKVKVSMQMVRDRYGDELERRKVIKLADEQAKYCSGEVALYRPPSFQPYDSGETLSTALMQVKVSATKDEGPMGPHLGTPSTVKEPWLARSRERASTVTNGSKPRPSLEELRARLKELADNTDLFDGDNIYYNMAFLLLRHTQISADRAQQGYVPVFVVGKGEYEGIKIAGIRLAACPNCASMLRCVSCGRPAMCNNCGYPLRGELYER